MPKEVAFTLKLEPELREQFLAEAQAVHRPASQVMRDYGARQNRVGMGDKLDKAHSLTFKPGGFAALPANMNHFAWTSSETVVQVHGTGPFAITYVNPKDDPSKK